MEIIVCFAIAFIIILVIRSKKSNSNVEKNYNKTERPESCILNQEDSHKQWEIDYEQRVIEENERINNGFYDNYRYIETNIAGVHYRTSIAQSTLASLDILSVIKLVREPNNPYDSSAVKIICDRKKLGYIPREYSSRVTKLMLNNQIRKVIVLESGKDLLSNFSDSLFVTLRIYYEPTPGELEEEKVAKKCR